MTSGAGRTLTWDGFHRLVGLTTQNVNASYAYSAGEERVRKTVNGAITRYFGAVAEVGPDGILVKHVFAGPVRVARKAGATTMYYHADRLGSVQLMTSPTGVVVRSYDYDAFGLRIRFTGLADNDFGFGGHRDGEGGLVYMQARYFDPALGRFISADSIVSDPMNPQALDRYAFGLNNPVSNVDPSGHAPVVAALVGVVVSGFSTWAIIGAIITTVGYLAHDPLLMSIGSVITGAALGGPWGAAIAAVTSPISPLDPKVKQAIGWAYMAYSLIDAWGATGPRVSEQSVMERMRQADNTILEIESRIQEAALSAPSFDYTTSLWFELPGMPNMAELAESVDRGFFGSTLHTKYGAVFELVAEQNGVAMPAATAMALNPSGGFTGDGFQNAWLHDAVVNWLPDWASDAILRHSIVHDAGGALRTTFQVGPGYSPYAPSNPLAGHVDGITRELARPTPGL